MNENLLERFGRSKRAFRMGNEQAHVWIQPQRLNSKIREYFDPPNIEVGGGTWLKRPEIPSSGEVLDTDTENSSNSDVIEVIPNKRDGAWESTGELRSRIPPHVSHELTIETKRPIWVLCTSCCVKTPYAQSAKLFPRFASPPMRPRTPSMEPSAYTRRSGNR